MTASKWMSSYGVTSLSWPGVDTSLKLNITVRYQSHLDRDGAVRFANTQLAKAERGTRKKIKRPRTKGKNSSLWSATTVWELSSIV